MIVVRTSYDYSYHEYPEDSFFEVDSRGYLYIHDSNEAVLAVFNSGEWLHATRKVLDS